MHPTSSPRHEPAVPPVALLEDPDVTRVALSPARRRLLLLLVEPQSATALAESLGESRQRIGYHLRALQKAGLVETVSTRRRGNCVEQILRARAQRFVPTSAALGELGDLDSLESAPAENPLDAFSWAYLVRCVARVLRDLAALRRRALAEKRRFPTFTFDSEIRFATPADFERFRIELAEAVTHVVERFHDPENKDGRGFRLVVASHPTISKPSSDGEPTTNGP